jgi:abhydrolase domain-containing protein 17
MFFHGKGCDVGDFLERLKLV